MTVDTATPPAEVVTREPFYQLWKDYRRNFTWAGSGNGYHRMEYPAVPGASFDGRMLVLPTGQGIEEMVAQGDIVYQLFDGDVDFVVDGALYPSGYLDLIAIPAGSTFSCTNVGLTNAVLCGLFAHPDSATGDTATAVEHMVWDAYKRDFRWTLPLAEQWGYHRGSGPLIRPPGLRGHTVRMIPGQSTPWHYAPRDLMFMPIDGEVEFEAANGVWPLGKWDMLLVPAFTPYKWSNYGLKEVVFLSIGGKLEPGKKGAYFDGNPGWPIRPDASRLAIEIDVYGDAKVVK
jgi:quercetin dioxygenase-like cupin family protein